MLNFAIISLLKFCSAPSLSYRIGTTSNAFIKITHVLLQEADSGVSKGYPVMEEEDAHHRMVEESNNHLCGNTASIESIEGEKKEFTSREQDHVLGVLSPILKL